MKALLMIPLLITHTFAMEAQNTSGKLYPSLPCDVEKVIISSLGDQDQARMERISKYCREIMGTVVKPAKCYKVGDFDALKTYIRESYAQNLLIRIRLIGFASEDVENLMGVGECLKCIKVLSFDGSRIDNEGVKKIAGSENFCNLTSLNLRSNPIGDKGAKAIAKSEYMSKLTTLNLACSGTGFSGIKRIAESQYMKQLVSLNLEHCYLDAKSAEVIADNMSNLTALNLNQNEIYGEGIVKIAQNLTGLRSLYLRGTGIDNEDVKVIAINLSNLALLDLGYNYHITNESVENLAQVNTLTALNLERTDITDVDAIEQALNLTSFKGSSIIK